MSPSAGEFPEDHKIRDILRSDPPFGGREVVPKDVANGLSVQSQSRQPWLSRGVAGFVARYTFDKSAIIFA